MKMRGFWLLLVLLGGWLLLGWVCQFGAALLWFVEVGYSAVFWRRLQVQVGIWIVVTGITGIFLLGNLVLAQRLQDPKYSLPPDRVLKPRRIGQGAIAAPAHPTLSTHATRPLALSWLLPLTLTLSLLIGILLLHYGQAVANLWLAGSQPLSASPLPDRLRWYTLWQMAQLLLLPGESALVPQITAGLLLIGAIALLIDPRRLLGAIALLLSVGLGLTLAAHWDSLLQLLYAKPFQRADPLFGIDIGFYIFALPLWELLEFWLIGMFLYAIAAVALIYLLAGNSLGQGYFVGLSRLQQRHLYGLGGCLMLAVSLSQWISRYELMYSTRGVVYGASYTDVTVQLPAYTALSLLTAAIALYLFWQSLIRKPLFTLYPLPFTLPPFPLFPALLCLSFYLLLVAIANPILPAIVQQLAVRPNELVRESPFIRRNIALTREAFDLETIDVKAFNPSGTLTYQDLANNALTVQNIRLWDTRPLLETNRQLQQIRSYYRFFDADIDRYTLINKASRATPEGGNPAVTEEKKGAQLKPLTQTTEVANTSETSKATKAAIKPATEKQQVLIAARELDFNTVPPEAKTWVNEHLIYTHGYGFTMSPVNQVAAGGLPDYFVKDIGTAVDGSEENLNTSSQKIRDSIPIGQPRIYYGELTNTYVMTGTQTPELDYPSGDDNVYNTYDGQGGVPIGAPWQRWLFARYLNDWQMLLTKNFTPQTKLLFRRNINDRIRAIAPFLRYDQDPYLVVADVSDAAQKPGQTEPNYLYWVVDAYTASDRYPYSEPVQKVAHAEQPLHSGVPVNYIRNSVKVVIDAYHGSVKFYIADPKDPMIQTWAAIFPSLFQPLDAMPPALRQHIRYPIDLFNIQSERLLTYHMTNPQVFYNREDQWQVPTEIYGNQPRLVQPYYVITTLPATPSEEFIQLLPFTPNQRTNLTAWLAARSDGENYGKALLYLFPKQLLVYGTEQIEARINQDPVISQQISLWNRTGSRAIQGNLLVIPIEQSLLYVEPLYLEAEQNSLPTLVRVIVAYENRIAMAETLDQALKAVFQPEKPTTPAIVRPVE